MTMRAVVVNLLLYQAGWIVAVLSAARGMPWVGASICALFLAVHLSWHPQRRRDVVVILAVAALGWCVDTLNALAGVFTFHGSGVAAWLCPPWLVGIWALFGSTLHTSLGWLRGRPLLGVLFGAVGGPLAYWAGARLGAVTAHPDSVYFLAMLAIVWGVLVPLLFAMLSVLPSRLSAQCSLSENSLSIR